MKNLGMKKLHITAVICGLLVLTLSVGTFAWFLKSYTVGGMDVESGKLGLTLTTYGYSDGAVTQIATNSEPDSEGREITDISLSSEASYGMVAPNKPLTFFVKVEKQEGTIDSDYGLSFYVRGLMPSASQQVDIEGTIVNIDDRIIYSGGFWYSIDEVTGDIVSDLNTGTEAEALAGTVGSTPMSGEGKDGLNNIDQYVYSESLSDENRADYYKVTVGMNQNSENVKEYADRQLQIFAHVNSSQKGYNNGDGNSKVHNVYTTAELDSALAEYRPGDKIIIKNDINYNRDLIFNRPVNLSVNGSVTLCIKGNLVYSFNSVEPCVIDTTGGGTIVVAKNGNSGGQVRINAPSSEFTLRGTNSLNAGMGDLYVQGTIELAASYKKGIIIDGFNIYTTTAQGEIPQVNEKYKDLYVTNGGHLIISKGTEVGNIYAALEDCYFLGITNNGTVESITLSSMYQDHETVKNMPQIYIDNNGMLNNTNIVLPFWSVPYDIDACTGNTNIIQNISGCAMTVSGPGSGGFTTDDIVRIHPGDLVVSIDDIGTNLLVYYYDVDRDGAYVQNTLQKIMTQFFGENLVGAGGSDYYTSVEEALEKIESIAIKTASDKFLKIEDYEYLRSFKNITSLDLSDAYTERIPVSITVGGTQALPEKLNEYSAHIPSETFADLNKLAELKLPGNTRSIGLDFVYGTAVKDIYLPATVTHLEVSTSDVNYNALAGVKYVHIGNTAQVVSGLTSRTLHQAKDDYGPRILVPAELVDQYKAYYAKDGQTHFNGDIYRERLILPEATLIYDLVTVKDAEGIPISVVKNEYLVREVEQRGWEIVYFHSPEGNMPEVIGEGLKLGNSSLNIIGLWKYSFYDVYHTTSSASGTVGVNLSFADTVKYIGDHAFAATTSKDQAANSTQRIYGLDLNNVESVGAYAFNSLLEGVKWKLNAENAGQLKVIGDYAFNYSGIESIYLPNAISLGDVGAFSNSPYLTSVDLPKLESFVGGFDACPNITDFRAASCKSICANAFKGKNNLVVLYLPCAEEIGNNAFEGTTAMRLIVLGRPVKWGTSMFSNCSAGRVIINANASDYEEDFLYSGSTGNSLKNGYFVISDKAYEKYGRTVFTSTPAMLDDTFYNVYDMVMDDGTPIGEVTSLYFEEGDKPCCIYAPEGNGYILIGPTARDLVNFATHKIPEEVNGKPVVGIAMRAFQDATVKGDIIIPSTVKSIGAYAFSGSTAADGENARYSFTFADGSELVTIGNNAFNAVSWLSEINIPNTVEVLSSKTFNGCDNLVSVTARGVKTLDKDASDTSNTFYGCSSLEFVDLRSLTRIEGKGAFVRSTSLKLIHMGAMEYAYGDVFKTRDNPNTAKYTVVFHGVPAQKYTSGSNGEISSQGKSIGFMSSDAHSYLSGSAFNDQEIGFFRDGMSGGDFYLYQNAQTGRDWLFTADATNGLGLAFCYADAITADEIAEDMALIEEYAEAQGLPGTDKGFTSILGCCFRLTGVTGDELDFTSGEAKADIEHIGRYSFYNSNIKIDSIIFPDSTVFVGDAAFDSSGFRFISIPGNECHISKQAFRNTSRLEYLDISGVKNLSATHIFYNSNVSTIMLDNVETISGSEMFARSKIKVLDAPNLKTLGTYHTFYLCNDLTSVNLPKLTTIYGQGNFDSCESLEYVYMPSLARIEDAEGSVIGKEGAQTFQACNNLLEIHVGSFEYIDSNSNVFGDSKALIIMHGVGAQSLKGSGKFAEAGIVSLVPFGKTGIYASKMGGSGDGCVELPSNISPDNGDIKGYGVYKTLNISAGAEPDTYSIPRYYYYLNSDGNIVIVFCRDNELSNDQLASDMRAIEDTVGNGAKVVEFGACSFRKTSFTNDELTIPTSVSKLGSSAFRNTTLTKIDATGVTTLGDNVFQDAEHIGEIKFSTLQSVGTNVFKNAQGMFLYITGPAPTEVISRNIFGSVSDFSGGIAILTEENEKSYNGCLNNRYVVVSSEEDLRKYGETDYYDIKIPLYLYAKNGNTLNVIWAAPRELTGNQIATELRTIWDQEFGIDAGIKSMTLGNYLFANKSVSGAFDLTGLPITSIGENIFQNTAKLEQIKLPESVKTIGASAFSNVRTLLAVYAPGVTTIGKAVFSGCTNIVVIDMPSLTTVGDNIFSSRPAYLTFFRVGGIESSAKMISTNSPKSNGIFIISEKNTAINSEEWMLKYSDAHMVSVFPHDGLVAGTYYNQLTSDYDTKNIRSFGTHTVNGIEVGKYYYVPMNGTSKIQILLCVPTEITAEELMADFAAMEDAGLEIVAIGDMSFMFTAITGDYLEMPESVVCIDKYAFDCKESSIRSLDLTNVVTLENNAFGSMVISDSINLGKKLTSIGLNAFTPKAPTITLELTGATTQITSPSNALFAANARLYVNEEAYSLYSGGWLNFTADRIVKYGSNHTANGVTFYFVPDSMGTGLKLLNVVYGAGSSTTELVIPNTVGGKNVTEIDGNAFYMLKDVGITKIHLPDYLAAGQFDSYDHEKFVTTLQEFEVSSSCQNYSVHEGVLYNKEQTVLLVYPTSKAGAIYTVPTTVQSIPMNSVVGATELRSIVR